MTATSSRPLTLITMRPSGPAVGLAVDALDDPIADPSRRGDQLLVEGRLAEAGDVVEEAGHVHAEVEPRGEHAEILVHAGRLRVVVAGAHVAVETDRVALLADDQGGLGVGLEPHQAVDHVGARLFQRSGPPDVRLLVEAGGHLDQHGHLLAVLGGPDQCGDDRAVTGGPVEALLDGEDVRDRRPPRSAAPPPTPKRSRRGGGRGRPGGRAPRRCSQSSSRSTVVSGGGTSGVHGSSWSSGRSRS